jgi:lipoprotein-anchoring transpeptidase ErfK/SrfK
VDEGSGVTAVGERRMRALLAVPISLLVAALSVVVVRSIDSPPAEAAPEITTTTVPPTTTTTTVPEPVPVVPVSTPLASPKGTIPTFDSPGGAEIGTAGFWYGYPMTMPIVEDRGPWLRIMVPERPNGSTAWVRREDVDLSSSAYRIVIRLPETRLYVYKDGFELFSAPVGIGKDSTPTAPGSFFVAVIEKPGSHGYGPVVLDTSGHSEAIRSWQGSGDAITAIHGPISASSDAQIGTTGTKISNGCIRMHEADQVKLDVIPLGTPVDIIA